MRVDAEDPQATRSGGLAPAALPWQSYTDPAVHRDELARIFARAWQYVGHTDMVREAGDCFPERLGEVPVLVVRATDGTLHGHVNVCRHRGSTLVREPSSGRTSIQCPYHAWTYELDGSLRAAPRCTFASDEERAGLSLLPVQVDTWGPFIFANPDPDAPALADFLGELPALVADAGVDVMALRHHSRCDDTVDANWKVCCENYLECYHCQVAHPGFSAVIDVRPAAYRLEPSASFSSQYGAVRDTAARVLDTTGEVERGQFHFLWPNTMINIAPGPANLSIGPAMPDGPERTRRMLDYFFAADTDPTWIEQMLEWDAQVGVEDTQLVRGVQAGMRGAAALGTRSPSGWLLEESEALIAHFHGLVRSALRISSTE